MKTKAAIIGGTDELRDAFSSSAFARIVIGAVIQDILGVKDALDRPAEYYVQKADQGPALVEGMSGVEIRITGISRNGRTPKQFHKALAKLEDITEGVVLGVGLDGARCQIFCVLILDGDVEVRPDSGVYSSVLEGTAFVAGERSTK